MDENTKLLLAVEEVLLEFADEQQDMTRSDFQGRASVVAADIIREVRQGVSAKIGEILKGEAGELIEALEELRDDCEY